MTVYLVLAEIDIDEFAEAPMCGGAVVVPGVFTTYARAEQIGERFKRDGYVVDLLEMEPDVEYA